MRNLSDIKQDSDRLLYKIKNAYKSLEKASNEKCTCTSFMLQYDGWSCEKSKKIKEAEQRFWGLIKKIK